MSDLLKKAKEKIIETKDTFTGETAHLADKTKGKTKDAGTGTVCII